MKSDIEIAHETELKNIREIAASIGIDEDDVYNYGKYIAKVPMSLIDEERVKRASASD